MTPLAEILARRIAATGPITLAEYMAECLLHPDHGYYTTRRPFGRDGDFVTAPEISQMFGEMLGVCLAQAWIDQGAPPAAILGEIGPGRGTLMADILRTTARISGFAPVVHLVEASPSLRRQQRQALAGHQVVWHDTIATLPDAPLFLVCNEFFDALPIRQFRRDPAGWRETVVGLHDGRLAPMLTDAAPVAALAARLADTSPGDIVEMAPAAQPVIAAVASRIAHNGGAAVIIDYGGWHSLGDTFQALRGHAVADPFAAPGTADLTAHVDFEALATAAAPAAVTAMVEQGVFLERLGITARAQTLASGLRGPALDNHVAAHRRLTHPEEMGSLFKVIALYPPGAAPPPGFER